MTNPIHHLRSMSLLAMTAIALSLGGCTSSEPGDPPPVVFISLDTVRKDALGTFGGTHKETPSLDAFAEDAVAFDHAFVQSPFTLPSHMSMFTGVLPDVHGVEDENSRLADSITTLAEIFSAAGYDSFGYHTNEWLKGDFGFNRGFQIYQRLPHRLTYADRVNAAGLATSRVPKVGLGPLFLFLHYFDAHSDFIQIENNKLPYYSPPEYRPGLEDIDPERFCTADQECATDFLIAADREGRELDPQTIAEIHQLYDGGIRYLDGAMGRLFEGLKKAGIYDSALILVTADHGEEFREHGRFVHSQTYDELIAVPLMIKLPGGRWAGRRVEEPVQSIDILPTLLDLLGLETPPYVQGRSLVPIMEGRSEESEQQPPVLAKDKLRHQRYALRAGGWKLIHDFETDHTELYDLEQDPGELQDLSQQSPDERRSLMRALARQLRANQRLLAELGRQEAADQVLTTEERDRLRALGYVE